MTDTDQATDNQTPTADDYRRGAALYTHCLRGDIQGVNYVLDKASQLDRTSALILAVATIGILAPGSALGDPRQAFDGLARAAIQTYDLATRGQ